MAEHIGIVVEVNADGSARVAADRRGACGGCDHQGGGCRSCISGANRMESAAANPVAAKVGDLVKIELASLRLSTGAALIYLLPVAGLLVGAFAGDQAAGSVAVSRVTGAVTGAFLGLAAGYVVLRAVDRSQKPGRRWLPTITRVVERNVGTPAGSVSPGEHASCCE